MTNIALVSAHGAHSSQFCSHAHDTLEDIVKAYIERGFSWFGITEHMPPISEQFVYPEELEAGYNAQTLYDRTIQYVSAARDLQKKYASQIKIFVGLETETYRGYESFVNKLIADFQFDYIVGSVHHVDNIPFDLDAQYYEEAARSIGSLDRLYCRYFDQQLEMINRLKPQIVGHLDLIRIFDPNYQQRLQKPEIRDRIRRNLRQIKKHGLVLDCNTRVFSKGATEPYPARSILVDAKEMGIRAVPGDDAHSVSDVGRNFDQGLALLQELGFDTEWPYPAQK